jgi:branched-chain amino acid transport system permease protein
MEFKILVQLLLNGLVLGSSYVLVAAGFTLVYGTARVFNFAHGHFYMLGAFLYGGLVLLGVPWVLSLAIAGFALALFGFLSWHLLFKPLYTDVFLTVATSVGLGLIMVQGVIVVAGERDVVVPSVFKGVFNLGETAISLEKVSIVLISVLVMFALHFFLRSRLGKALEATTIDPEGALLQGINTGWMFVLAMIIGSALAGIAGAVIVPYLSAQPNMGYPITTTYLCIVVVAGHGSLRGAVIIGLLFGLVKSFGYHFLGTWDYTLMLLLVAVIMFVRPWGIWGVEFRRST